MEATFTAIALAASGSNDPATPMYTKGARNAISTFLITPVSGSILLDA